MNRHSKKAGLSIERCEPRHLLSAIGFAAHYADWENHNAELAADIDNDGDQDLLFRGLSWKENIDGMGTFAKQERIATGQADELAVADVDGDGDNDILAARDREIVWYENLNGRTRFGPAVELGTYPNSIYLNSFKAADIDADGDIDLFLTVLGRQDRRSFWYEQVAANKEFTRHELDGHSQQFVDFDGDQDLDIIIASDTNIFWLEKLNGTPEFAEPATIVILPPDSLRGFAVGDVDDDSDVDIVYANRKGATWLRNDNGEFEPVETDFESDVFSFNERVHLTDFDGDRDLDLLIEREYVGGDGGWWLSALENDGSNFAFRHVVMGDRLITRPQFFLGDVDGDAGTEIFGVSRTSLERFTFDTETHLFAQSVEIVAKVPFAAETLADFDSDGDLDQFYSRFEHSCTIDHTTPCVGEIWYRPFDSLSGDFGDEILLDDPFHIPKVSAVDLDEDGDLDVLGMLALPTSGGFIWYENTDGQGTFGPLQPLAPEVERLVAYDAQDIDGDGDVDLIGWLPGVNSSVALENLDNSMDFGPATEIPSSIVADMDSDGDLDFLIGTDTILWTKNDGGFVSQGETRRITTNQGRNLTVGDIDGDGDNDILNTSTRFAEWYENQNDGREFQHRPIGINDSVSHWAPLVDVDSDGALDLIVQKRGGLVWHRNEGLGTFSDEMTLLNVSIVTSHGDIDGDGDLDFVSGSTLWHENRPIGDANDDGVFNSSDLVQVFRAGEYEDFVNRNSTFQEGDWNADGDFDSNDLVVAFQAGTYVKTSSSLELAAIEELFMDENDDRRAKRNQRAFVA